MSLRPLLPQILVSKDGRCNSSSQYFAQEPLKLEKTSTCAKEIKTTSHTGKNVWYVAIALLVSFLSSDNSFLCELGQFRKFRKSLKGRFCTSRCVSFIGANLPGFQHWIRIEKKEYLKTVCYCRIVNVCLTFPSADEPSLGGMDFSDLIWVSADWLSRWKIMSCVG